MHEATLFTLPVLVQIVPELASEPVIGVYVVYLGDGPRKHQWGSGEVKKTKEAKKLCSIKPFTFWGSPHSIPQGNSEKQYRAHTWGLFHPRGQVAGFSKPSPISHWPRGCCQSLFRSIFSHPISIWLSGGQECRLGSSLESNDLSLNFYPPFRSCLILIIPQLPCTQFPHLQNGKKIEAPLIEIMHRLGLAQGLASTKHLNVNCCYYWPNPVICIAS